MVNNISFLEFNQLESPSRPFTDQFYVFLSP